ncbi:MAG: hypothetical protein EB117_18310, partial [Betaproteobacteria bacterium]|nr:hypothetical protein [Betaproteobacteria bacterium]
MSFEVLEYLIKKCQDEESRLAETLGQGLAKDHADYRHQCGIIRGLAMARQMLIDTAERMENDN